MTEAAFHQRYDRNNKLIGTTDAGGYERTLVLNERGDVMAEINELGNVTRYDVNAHHKIKQRISAAGYIEQFNHDSNGNVTEERYSNPSTQATPLHKSHHFDPFGNATGGVDPAGVEITIELDGLNNPVSQTTHGAAGHHGDRPVSDEATVPTGDQHLVYQCNEAGQVIAIYDEAQNQQTVYLLQKDGRHRGVWYTAGKDGVVFRAVEQETDGLQRVTKISDTQYVMYREYDASGNVIHLEVFYYDGKQLQPSAKHERWFKYIPGTDLMQIECGVFNPTKKQVEIAQGQGIEFSYESGYRTTETAIDSHGKDSTSKLAYESRGYLTTVTSSDGKTEYYTYGYDAAGNQVLARVSDQTVTWPIGNFKSNVVTTPDKDGGVAMTHEHAGKTPYTMTTEERDAERNITRQLMRTDDKQLQNNIGNTYSYFMDAVLTQVKAICHRKHGGPDTKSELMVTVDPYGHATSKSGAEKEGFRFMVTTFDGLTVVVQTAVHSGDTTYYYYDADGHLLGKGDVTGAKASVHEQAAERYAAKVAAEHQAAAARQGKPTASPSMPPIAEGDETQEAAATDDEWVDTAAIDAAVAAGQRAAETVLKQFRGDAPPRETVEPTFDFTLGLGAADKQIPLTGPSSITIARDDMTYYALSVMRYGTGAYASVLASRYGANANDVIPVGETIETPNFPNLRDTNWYGNYAHLTDKEIFGSLIPTMQIPTLKHHSNWIVTMLEVAISIALTALLPPIGSEWWVYVLVGGIVSGMTYMVDSLIETIADGGNVQFSLQGLLKSITIGMATAGLAKGLNLTPTNLLTTTQKVGSVVDAAFLDACTQAMQEVLYSNHEFSIGEVMAAMAGQALNVGVSTELPLDANSSPGEVLRNASLQAAGNVLLDKLLVDPSMGWQDMLGQFAGRAIGGTVVSWASVHKQQVTASSETLHSSVMQAYKDSQQAGGNLQRSATWGISPSDFGDGSGGFSGGSHFNASGNPNNPYYPPFLQATLPMAGDAVSMARDLSLVGTEQQPVKQPPAQTSLPDQQRRQRSSTVAMSQMMANQRKIGHVIGLDALANDFYGYSTQGAISRLHSWTEAGKAGFDAGVRDDFHSFGAGLDHFVHESVTDMAHDVASDVKGFDQFFSDMRSSALYHVFGVPESAGAYQRNNYRMMALRAYRANLESPNPYVSGYATGRLFGDLTLSAGTTLATGGAGLATARVAGRVGGFFGSMDKVDESAEQAYKLNRFDAAAKELPQEAKQNIRVLRGWAKSRGYVKLPNAEGGPEKWGVINSKGRFEWRLRIKPEASLRTPGSEFPRFDARIFVSKRPIGYINPFTGETGGTEIGTHIDLSDPFGLKQESDLPYTYGMR